jgi:cytochrome c-type biogenesis protein CcmF
MDWLTGFYVPGALTLWCALIFALCSFWGYTRVATGDAGALEFGRRSYRFYVVAIVLASLVLTVALLRRDFRIEYVFDYSGLDLPDHFQFAAFWAGQKGSFLIWLLFSAVLGLGVMRTAGRNEGAVMGFYLLTTLALLLLLVRQNPFTMLSESPADGKGLNPLLQDPWMVIHPPIMFVGYAASAIPFAFAAAAMWKRDYRDWAARAFPWTLAGAAVLGLAILLGGYWAYKTLGWGGFWGWDPVENASLIPWLLGVSLLHGLHMERTQGRYRRANLVLATLLFLSVWYGTYLTRSGVLADFSVHSFVDFGIRGWLVAVQAVFIFLSVALLATRLRGVTTKPNEDALLSRGSFLVMGTIAVLISAVVVTVGTSAPMLTRFFSDNPTPVGPSFYNQVNFPLALLIAGLLAAVPYLTWRGAEPRELLRKMAPAGAVALVATIVAAVLGVHDPFHLLFFACSALALVTNLQKTWELGRKGGFAATGGYLAHVGVAVILLGILASSAYDQSLKVTLEQGKKTDVDGYGLTFQRFVPRGSLPEECGDKECMEVLVDDGSSAPYLAYPKLFINARTEQLMASPHIRSYVTRDLYISPIEFDPGDPSPGQKNLRLVAGEPAVQLGDLSVRFVAFDLNAEGNAQVQLASGGQVSIGATVEITRGGRTETITPVYRFVPNVDAETPPVFLPGGGSARLAALSPNDQAITLALAGLADNVPVDPARLAVDVTRKPLIQLVWGGLYLILAGFGLAAVHRFRQTTKLDAVA